MADTDVYQLVVGTNQDGEKLANVFHYQQSGSDGALPPEAALKNGWVTTMMPLLRACYSVEAAIESLRIKRVPAAIEPSYVFVIDEEGDQSGDALPPNSCALISLYTLEMGPHGRGRTHISAYPESEHSDGIINEDQLGLLNDFGNALVSPISGGGGEPTFQAGIFGESEVFYEIVDVQVRAYLHTLRSRRMRSP